MSWTVTIDGVAHCPTANGVNIRNRLNEIPSAGVSLTEQTAGVLDIQEGDGVVINYDGDDLFGGYVRGVRITENEAGVKIYNLECDGWLGELRRRLAYERYTNKTAGFIIGDIITRYLVAEGYTAGTITAGANVAKLIINGRNILDVFRNLAAVNGYMIWIEPDKTVHFEPPALTAAGFDLGDGWDNYQTLGVSVDLSNYHNKISVDGWAVTGEQNEVFSGDGERRTFGVAFPMWEKPTVRVNGVAKSVGILGLSTGNDWYWSKFSQDLSQDEGGTSLAGAGTVTRTQLSQYDGVSVGLTLLAGMHAWSDYLVLGMSDTDGGYVLYKRNGTAWEQVNNLTVFTGRRVSRIVGMGSYFVGYETYGADAVDINVYQILGDKVSFVATIDTTTAFGQRVYWQAWSRHVAYDLATLGNNDVVVDVVADDGTVTSATGLTSDKTLDYRFFVGYSEGFMLVLDDASGDYAGATLRQLKADGNVYSITTDPPALTGTFDRGFASNDQYVFIRTTDGVEWYKRAGATLTKLTTIAEPSGYTFSNSFTDNKRTQLGLYDDWLVVPVDESPYVLTWRIDRATDTVAYTGGLDMGLSGAVRFVAVYAGGFFVGKYNDDEVVGAYTEKVVEDVAADTLEVDYTGIVRTIYATEDATDVAYRAGVNGGTGLWELRESLGRDEAGGVVEYARRRLAELALNRRIAYRLGADRAADGAALKTGMSQGVDVPAVGYVGAGIVLEVGYGMQELDKLTTSVNLVQSNVFGSWEQFLRLLWGKKTGEIVSDDLLQIPLAFGDVASVTDDADITVETISYEWDESEWDEGEWL